MYVIENVLTRATDYCICTPEDATSDNYNEQMLLRSQSISVMRKR